MIYFSIKVTQWKSSVHLVVQRKSELLIVNLAYFIVQKVSSNYELASHDYKIGPLFSPFVNAMYFCKDVEYSTSIIIIKKVHETSFHFTTLPIWCLFSWVNSAWGLVFWYPHWHIIQLHCIFVVIVRGCCQWKGVPLFTTLTDTKPVTIEKVQKDSLM